MKVLHAVSALCHVLKTAQTITGKRTVNVGRSLAKRKPSLVKPIQRLAA